MFEKWYLEELMNKNIREIWPLTDNYLVSLMIDILNRNGIDKLLDKNTSITDIINKFGFCDKAYNSLRWILERLKFSEYVESTELNDNVLYKFTGKKIDFDAESIYRNSVEKEPDCKSAFDILKLMASNYDEFLRGTKTGVEIVFSPENIHIMNEYYDRSLFYNANNTMGAKVLNHEIDIRNNPYILELGGGMGGGTKRFLTMRKDEKKPINCFKYHFTDVANKMIRNIKKTLEVMTDDVSVFEFGKFDFNKSIEEVGAVPNTYDIIWAVNAIHVAYDLEYTLKEIYKILKPGGVLLIAETVRPTKGPMIQQEFVINTLDDYWNVKLDADYRPNYGFITWDKWVKALEKAGYDIIETVPDMRTVEKEHDNCYTTVIKGIKK